MAFLTINNIQYLFSISSAVESTLIEVDISSKVFQTPGFPVKYSDTKDYEWILVGEKGKQVQLTILAGTSEECCDKLQVASNLIQ